MPLRSTPLLVRTSACPVGERASLARAQAYGPKSPDWFANLITLVILGSSQLSLLGDSTLSSPTWPRSGMTRNGTAYRLPTLAPPICATAYGLWPTPCKSSASPRQTGTWTGRYFIKPNGQKSQTRLEDMLRGRPNPMWIEWLMGFPISWTDVQLSVTP